MIEIILKNGEHLKIEENEYKCYDIENNNLYIYYGYDWFICIPFENILYYKIKRAKAYNNKIKEEFKQEMVKLAVEKGVKPRCFGEYDKSSKIACPSCQINRSCYEEKYYTAY